MCGHAVIALGRYAVDHGLIAAERIREPETEVRIHCPCGVVTAYTELSSGRTTGRVRFHSVPAFAFALGQYFILGGPNV
jgi:proline racemase